MNPARLLAAFALSAAAVVAPTAAQPPAAAGQIPQTTAAASVVEMQSYRASGVVTAWLSNGVCIHHRRMESPPGRVEAVISLSGGELLECAETRGLTLLSAAFFNHPAARHLPATEVAEALDGRDVRIEGGVMADALLVKISGSAADIGPGIRIAAAALLAPQLSEESLDATRSDACQNVERIREDIRWSVTEPLLEMVTPVNECRNKLACTKRMSGYDAKAVEGWIIRHSSKKPCEIAIVGDSDFVTAMRIASEAFASFPDRPRPAPCTLADQRCVKAQAGPFTREVGCANHVEAGEAHVLAGFLSPDPAQILEVRQLRAGARVLAERLERRLRDLKLGGDPHVTWMYLPSPFAGRSVTVVSARVAPVDAEPVKKIMQAGMCELIDQGLTPEELSRTTDILARVTTAYERDPRYWAAVLARCNSGGLDPEQVIGGAEVYRAMKPDDVLGAMRRACSMENRLDLVVRPE